MPDMNVGGQAVIEGVMMRSRDRISTAVRAPDGKILVKTQEYSSLTRRYKLLGLPIVRGAVVFAEMLVVGVRTLNFSAEIAIRELEKEEAAKKGIEIKDKPGKRSETMLLLTAFLAVALGIVIFFFVPLAISTLFNVDKNAVGFNLIAGTIRLTMFVLYVWGISLFGEFQRIFQYHGAEHKSIFTLERGDDLVPEQAALHSRFHPRCGTSFILIVAFFAVATYAVSDTIYTLVAGHPPALLARFAVHFSLLPLVAGGSYELLKLSGRTRESAITKILIAPGLWLQKITTKEPSMDQLEVAIVALEGALGVSESKITSDRVAVP